MGGKYEVRFYIQDEFVQCEDVYTNSFVEFLKIMFKNRKKLIYFTVRF